jgi:shikimate dehydrogenase
MIRAGLIGEGIAGSLTPPMHEAEARAQGLELSYVRFDTAEGCRGLSLKDLLQEAQDQGYAGVNVTHPFKDDAVALMDMLSDAARDLGAVNTVLFKGSKRIGHNTDFTGFGRAFAASLGDAAKDNVVLFGAGGAGRAVALALLDGGVKRLRIVDPQPGKAEALVERLQTLRPDASLIAKESFEQDCVRNVSGVVNATPLGMDSHPGMAVDPEWLPKAAWVADIVYFPLETAFLARARAAGLKVMSGAGMAVHQAAEAFTHFTGLAADPARMAASFEQLCPGGQGASESN